MVGCAALSFVAALVMHRYDGRIVADWRATWPAGLTRPDASERSAAFV